MSKHTDTMTTAALRDLDPAGAAVLTGAERERADATFARILATPGHDQVPEPSKWPRRIRLLVPAALVAAAAVAVPSLLLGGGSAFASWTPTPEPLTDTAAARAAAACRSGMGMPDGVRQAVIAEKRGGWTYVLLAGPTSEGACLMPEGLADQQDPAADTRKGFIGHYESTIVKAPDLAADDIEGYGGTSSLPTNGFWGFGDDEEWINSVEGYVGSDVAGVTVHAPIGVDVEASVANGRFAAWWPSPKESSENAEVMGRRWTYTVTLADGTARRATD